LGGEPFKRDFWDVVCFAEYNVHDASAFSGFELEILKFELEARIEIRVFDGFFGSMQLIWR
jgi:hypothetical protein